MSSHRRFPSSIDSSCTSMSADTEQKKTCKKADTDALASIKYASFDASTIGIKRVVTAPSFDERRLISNTAPGRQRPTMNDRKSATDLVGLDGGGGGGYKKPTSELLAQLLKGSSEKFVAEQHQQRTEAGQAKQMQLPSSVLKCLVS